jgi:CDP-diacylglycerol--glycerol-3-phosphate 3-phosphatidyltransferase
MARDAGAVNVPNALSFLRLGAVVPLAVLLWAGRDPAYTLADALALGLYAASFGTDLVDGWLARRWRQETSVGQLLDPLADKVLIACCLVFLVERAAVPAWAVVAILAREMAVTGLRGLASAQDVIIKASRTAKGKTLLQSIAVLLLLLPPTMGAGGVLAGPLGVGVLYAAVLLTVVSGAEYFYGFFRGSTAASAPATSTGPATR